MQLNNNQAEQNCCNNRMQVAGNRLGGQSASSSANGGKSAGVCLQGEKRETVELGHLTGQREWPLVQIWRFVRTEGVDR
jgi:hypothetical protein